MKIALGVFNWTPDVFWKSTTDEFLAALDGWEMMNGEGESGGKVLSKNDVDKLKHLMDKL